MGCHESETLDAARVLINDHQLKVGGFKSLTERSLVLEHPKSYIMVFTGMKG
jgi:hypothetical protein